MNFIKKNWHKLVLSLFSFFIPVISYAQTGGNSSTGGNSGCNPAGGKICNPIAPLDTFGGLVHKLLEGAIKVGLPVVALAIIYCGFLFVRARGNPEQITKAKEALLYTLIGAAILLGSLAISELISNTVLSLQ